MCSISSSRRSLEPRKQRQGRRELAIAQRCFLSLVSLELPSIAGGAHRGSWLLLKHNPAFPPGFQSKHGDLSSFCVTNYASQSIMKNLGQYFSEKLLFGSADWIFLHSGRSTTLSVKMQVSSNPKDGTRLFLGAQ